jgi:class 3 adenylate cyclase
MEEQLIQYATTSDGVSIAYATSGEGRPVVLMPEPPLSHVQRQPGPIAEWARRFERELTFVVFDARGLGLSDREVTDLSLDARVKDLEAVAGRLNGERFDLVAATYAVPPAVAYAVRHSDRVSHLVLHNPIARSADLRGVAATRALVQLLRRDWEMFTENVGAMVYGWGSKDAQRFGAYMRSCVTEDLARRMYEAMDSDDVTHLLPEVSVPTLVLHGGVKHVSVDIVRRIAASIDNARLMMVEPKQVINAMSEFIGVQLSDTPPAAAEPEHRHETRSLVSILFTDLASSTAITQRLGDAKAQELVRAHNTIVREALAAHDGTEIKHTGDGIMASFGSASGALECAVAIQRGVAGHDAAALAVKIGLNAGEPVAEESDLFGTAVQLARRVCDEASGGEILVSDVVRQLAAGKDFLFSDRGVADLKGFDEPVRLFEVRWREEL